MDRVVLGREVLARRGQPLHKFDEFLEFQGLLLFAVMVVHQKIVRRADTAGELPQDGLDDKLGRFVGDVPETLRVEAGHRVAEYGPQQRPVVVPQSGRVDDLVKDVGFADPRVQAEVGLRLVPLLLKKPVLEDIVRQGVDLLRPARADRVRHGQGVDGGHPPEGRVVFEV